MRRWRVRRGGACACGGLRAFAPRAQVTRTLTPCLGPLSDCLLSSAGGVPGHVGLQAAIWPGVDTHTASDSWEVVVPLWLTNNRWLKFKVVEIQGK